MKRFLALTVSALVVCTALSACGGSAASSGEGGAAPAAGSDAAASGSEGESKGGSESKSGSGSEKSGSTAKKAADFGEAKATSDDLTFEDLQNNYAILTEIYNYAEELYTSDLVAQSDEAEANLTEAKSLIDEIGELNEADFPDQASINEMNDSFVTLIDAIGAIVDTYEPAEDGKAAE